MAKPDIIYDTEREIAALVDLDSMRALGPIMVGQGATEMLQEFVSRMPEAAFDTDSFTLTALWGSYFAENFAPLTEPPAATDTSTVGMDHGTSDDAASIPTTTTGAPTDEPPGAQPADTDMEANASTPATVVGCPACGGGGRITVTDGEPPVTCNMCQGTGKILQHA